MSPANLKQFYGRQIVFHGGLDTQDLLPHGNQASIEQGVKALLDDIYVDGGYISVSYTHLDVYKRQFYECSRCFKIPALQHPTASSASR